MKLGYMKKLNPYVDSKGNYLAIRLIRNDGLRKGLLIHRLVAIHFISNPLNLPEVNHIDNNPKKCIYTNLEWCTRKYNLQQSYKTKSPKRNCNRCKLYKNGIFIKDFDCIMDAVKISKEKYHSKSAMLEKYLIYKDIVIVPSNQNRKYKVS